ncbi:MAG: PHP domain-containing protein [Symbiobacterium sp.]|uniref:PHP domain-containing protein n=1 Tax=Symbiobacterium sp. TaxID=1971213 RepID=UPI0034645A2E
MEHIPMPPPAGRADLHNHTTVSDGTLSPAEQVRWAAAQGLAAVAITDHDSIGGWAEARAAAQEAGIEFVPGVELSTEVGKIEVHILGYYLDPDEPGMAELLRRMRGGRRNRVAQVVAKLHELGLREVSLERILERGGESVGRPHVAAELVEIGAVGSLKEAFERFLDRGRPAYVPRPKLEPAEAIAAVRRAGGVPVLAHPGLIGDDRWVHEAIAAGIMGIEAYHTDHDDRQRAHYARWGREAGLLVTGGTDSHGPRGTRTVLPGSVNVSLEVVEKLKALSAWYQRAGGALA